MDPYFQSMFMMALGIQSPWRITSIEMVEGKRPELKDMRITIDFEEGARFPYPGEAEACPVYDTHERTWRHLNFFQYRCYITARMPRIRLSDGKIRSVEAPWGREGSGFTLMMEGVILTLVQNMSVAAVAREIGEHDTRLWRVIGYHVEKALELQDFSDVTGIGVDEYSHRGHNYITVFLAHPSEGTKGRVLFVTRGKDKGCVPRFVEQFKAKKGDVEKVVVTTSDMIHGFRNAMAEAFPEAVETVDKFHVVKNCEDAVDSVRRREMRGKSQKKCRLLDGTRYIWLKNEENLTVKQREKLEELLQVDYLDTVKAYDMRLRLQDFYSSHDSYDEGMVVDFEELALDFCNSSIKEMQKFGKLLTANAEHILNYFDTKSTNAILEGFNSKISLIKNRARGFRNMDNFMNMIYFCCGGLELPFAPIM